MLREIKQPQKILLYNEFFSCKTTIYNAQRLAQYTAYHFKFCIASHCGVALVRLEN
jgi:hypothetical protein